VKFEAFQRLCLHANDRPFLNYASTRKPCAGSVVVRIDLLRFLAGRHTRQKNQTRVFPLLDLDFLSVSVVLLTRAQCFR